MCIALISTAHPAYALILIDNRDEFLNRPTARASWWPAPNEHVLGARDLLRPAHGTWLGISKNGRIAVLTNFREEGEVVVGAQSRGAMINAFLTGSASTSQTTEQFVKELIASGAPQQVGGFSLVCGQIGQPLAVISNRVSSEQEISWVAGSKGETVGLSNAAFGDKSWPKVVSGEKLLDEALEESLKAQEDESLLLERLLELLSIDTLPRMGADEAGLETYLTKLRHSIFVPPLGRQAVQEKPSSEIRAAKAPEKARVVEEGKINDIKGMSGVYGTQKQTVVLVGHDGRVRFVERTLYDDDLMPIERGHADSDFVFNIEAYANGGQ